MAKKVCAACGKELGMMNGKVKTADGFMCSDCFKKAGFSSFDVAAITAASSLTTEQVNLAGKEKADELSIIANFQPTSVPSDCAKFDDNTRQMILSPKIHISYKPEHYVLLNYNQIVDFELIEDGTSIASGGLGRAAVGGVLFGGVGAVVGGVTGKHKNKQVCTQLKIKLTVRDYIEPAFYITLISSEIKKSSFTYKSSIKTAQNILSQLQIVVNSLEGSQNNNNPASVGTVSPVDITEEIRKYKSLLDDGIITQEEFDQKKRKLMGL